MTLDNLTPEELELAALSTLRTVDDVRLARSAGVSELSFQTAKHIEAWEYVCSQADLDRQASPEDLKVICGVELIEA